MTIADFVTSSLGHSYNIHTEIKEKSVAGKVMLT